MLLSYLRCSLDVKMLDSSSRGLLIAILIVVGINLAATLVQTGLLLRTTSGIAVTATAAEKALPAKYTDAALVTIADRLVAPYNKHDIDALYAEFDEIAKSQIPRDKFDTQLTQLSTLVGKVESSSFVGSQKQQSQGRLDMYQLNYLVRLSGASFPTGTMTITVVDRESGPGIVGFFINGKTQQ
jgi:hypothetical protein